MLKITPLPASSGETCFGLEGRLVGPWVSLLRNALTEAEISPSKVRLNLSGVLFVDSEGLALLHALRKQGVVLKCVTPFIEELLLEKQT
jgi:ABC-type transporter Mla MlaB component